MRTLQRKKIRGFSQINLGVLTILRMPSEKSKHLSDLSVPPHTKNCRYLLPGCKNVLTPENLQLLTGDRNSQMTIKIHEPPFSEYFAGEYAIQPIRHPGAVL